MWFRIYFILVLCSTVAFGQMPPDTIQIKNTCGSYHLLIPKGKVSSGEIENAGFIIFHCDSSYQASWVKNYIKFIEPNGKISMEGDYMGTMKHGLIITYDSIGRVKTKSNYQYVNQPKNRRKNKFYGIYSKPIGTSYEFEYVDGADSLGYLAKKVQYDDRRNKDLYLNFDSKGNEISRSYVRNKPRFAPFGFLGGR